MVRGGDLRRAWSGARGDEQWRRYKETKLGISVGMFVVALPALLGLLPYYLHGVSTAELVAALPGALLDGIVGSVATLGPAPGDRRLPPPVGARAARVAAIRRFV